MKILLSLAIAAAGCVSLSACATGGMTPAQAHQMFTDFKDAGCGGQVDIEAGAASGQLGGEAHASVGLHGKCPTAAEVQAAKAPAAPAPSLTPGAVVAPAAPND